MLSLGKFPMQLQHGTVFFHNPKSQNLHFPSKPDVSFPSNRPTPFGSLAFPGKKSGGFCSNALKTKKKDGFTVAEMEGFEEFEDGFDDDEFVDDEDDGEFEGDESDEDDEVIVPLQNMKEWFENRPRGFGEGKVYDTSVEDELMEEIEQSRKAQLANVNELKSNPMKANSKKELPKQNKASSRIPNGFRVRMANLPKKKNIHKDLRLAFEGVPGIQNIEPVVSGNEKTRDPVCKGLAFIDFKYKKEAERFVENFSGTSLSFGKVQKQIKCELLNSTSQPANDLLNSKSQPASNQPKPESQKPASNQLHKKASRPPKQAVLSSENVFQANVDTNISFLSSGEEVVLSEHDDADEHYVVAQWEDDEESTSKFREELGTRQESTAKSTASKQGRKIRQNDKKEVPNMKKDNKIPRLNIPGSAKRLKIKEKSVLIDVFSKYGAKASSSIVEEQSR
ncbi:uncharacterized protein [Primulina eburnea]|uniref:uncharacterized protein isoform X2 n=1 Tax=Primulina eburnea TaxID=1245227 RepID=UPI003C6C175E